MSTAARKARKRAGIPFTKPAKMPTPVEDRTATKKAGERLLRRVMRMVGNDPEAAAKVLAEGAERAETEK